MAGNLPRRVAKAPAEPVWRAASDETATQRLSSLTSAFQHYSSAIRTLATGHDDLNHRLHHAWIESIMHIRPEGLPESMRRSTEYIMESLRDPSGVELEQQSDLAAEILAIYTEIALALEHQKPNVGIR